LTEIPTTWKVLVILVRHAALERRGTLIVQMIDTPTQERNCPLPVGPTRVGHATEIFSFTKL
jgi:hypothetical protein